MTSIAITRSNTPIIDTIQSSGFLRVIVVIKFILSSASLFTSAVNYGGVMELWSVTSMEKAMVE